MNRRPGRRGKFLLMVLAMAACGPAAGTGLREHEDSWLLNILEVWALLQGPPLSGPMAGLKGPAKGIVIRAGSGELFGMPELPQSQVGGDLMLPGPGGGLGLGISWQVLGADLYRESRLKLEVDLGRTPALGLDMTRHQTVLAGQGIPPSWQVLFTLEHRFILSPSYQLRLHLTLDAVPNSDSFLVSGRQPLLDMALLTGTAALALCLERAPDGTPLLGGECFWSLGQGAGLAIRFDPATASLGPGIYLRRGPLLLRTSHLAHPVLGQTHRLSLALVRLHD